MFVAMSPHPQETLSKVEYDIESQDNDSNAEQGHQHESYRNTWNRFDLEFLHKREHKYRADHTSGCEINTQNVTTPRPKWWARET